MDKRYTKTVNIIGWCVFALTLVLYIFTLYPTVAFWDCGEFIAASANLYVPHQPGAPLYQLIGSVIASFSFGNTKLIAPLINGISAVSSAISVMLLYHLFLYLFNKYSDKPVGNVVAAVISSLTFAVTDSFWTCSTEAEVYSLSFLFTTLCLHIIIQWEEKPQEKYLVLLSLILGMSYGVHPLTLLIIPAIVFIVWFHYRKITIKGIIYSILISIGALYVFVNAFDWLLRLFEISVWGTITTILLLCGILLAISYIKRYAFLNSAIFCFIFFFIGCSAYTVLAIRSTQHLTVNEYPTDNAKDMRAYITRQSYIHAPLLYGAYYTALPATDVTVKANKIEPVFDKEFYTPLPRMWNYTSASYEDGYSSWVGKPENSVWINGEQREKPSFKQNIQFFAKYQFGYMYWRYLLWNFCGKTNDMQGYGDITNGQWQTGYYYTDRIFNIDEGRTPLSKRNKANNRYFAIPLLLCLVGVFYHIIKDSKRFLFVGTIFIMYSLALVVYNNMVAYEPRERDYIYLPSFMAVSIWIGIGILGISQMIANLIRVRKPRYILPVFLIVPIWMCIENYNDHNHHHQYTARNFAVSLLNSCAKDAVLFTDGDNDTYPLWYAQQVEKIRQDVKVVNRELLNNAYYIKQLTETPQGGKRLELQFTQEDFADGIMDEVQLTSSFDTLEVTKAVREVKNDKIPDAKLGNHVKNLHCNQFKIYIDSSPVVFRVNDAVINKSDMIMLDIIASNKERPIYFSSYSNDNFLGLDNYLSLEGFAYRLNGKKTVKDDDEEVIPLKAGVIDADKMYTNVMHGFEFYNFNRPTYFNETERSIVNFFVENISALLYKLIQTGQDSKAEVLINKLIESIPPSIHYYPYSLADIAVCGAMTGEREHSEEWMRMSMNHFKTFLDRYNKGTVRFQAQNRLQAAKAVSYLLNLCVICENWGLESERIMISDEFFTAIKPYIEVTLRQRKIMMLEQEWYQEEIDRINDLLAMIEEFAEHYEEKLPDMDLI